jgi:hypothetical protein
MLLKAFMPFFHKGLSLMWNLRFSRESADGVLRSSEGVLNHFRRSIRALIINNDEL